MSPHPKTDPHVELLRRAFDAGLEQGGDEYSAQYHSDAPDRTSDQAFADFLASIDGAADTADPAAGPPPLVFFDHMGGSRAHGEGRRYDVSYHVRPWGYNGWTAECRSGRLITYLGTFSTRSEAEGRCVSFHRTAHARTEADARIVALLDEGGLHGAAACARDLLEEGE